MVWSDSAERSIYAPLAAEAERRGFRVRLTDNPFEKCDIGIYCQHVNFPENSAFSAIMLHDIIQQYNHWPDIWLREPWNKYDVGILPSSQWEKNWTAASGAYYARPRRGVWKAGWPKADTVVPLAGEENRKRFYAEHGLDPGKRTVLYAPAWENDGKEDDFVRAMEPLGVNILIKQWEADPRKYPDQVANVRKMQEMHEGLPGVTILPPETNIFVAIAACDLLVSEESSTMCEAAMMGIPALSVSDWLIPDTKPSRLPRCDYDFVWMTEKAKLGEKVREMLGDYEGCKARTEAFERENFPNPGTASAMILDIIEDCIAGREPRYPAIAPREKERVPIGKYCRHMYEAGGRIFVEKYAKKYAVCRLAWNAAKKVIRRG